MQLTDFARRLPEEVWTLFEPVLPKKVWFGNGRPPAADRACLHGLFYVLVSGIGWRMLPPCFPSYRTIQRRMKRWLEDDCFLTAWRLAAERYEALRGINWDQVCLDGSKRPAKKGANAPAPARWTVPNAAPPSTWSPTDAACPWGP